MPRLPPGRYKVTVTTPDGLVAQTAEVPLGSGEAKRLRLVVEPGATLVGRVVEDASDAPAAEVEVHTRLPGLRRASTRTDQNGAFTLRGVLAGEKMRVSAFREGGTPDSGRAEVDVPALGATVQVGTIRLRPRQPQAPGPEAKPPR